MVALATCVPAIAAAEPGDDPAIARQEGMHIGVGVDSTLGGVQGVSFRQGLGPIVGVEGVLAIDHGTPEYVVGGGTGAATTVGVAARAIVPLRRLERGLIAAVGGVDVGVRKQTGADTGVELAVEGGVRAEYFLASHLSLNLEVGAVYDHPPSMQTRILVPAVSSSRPTPATTTVSLDNTVLAGGAGLTFWFR